MKKEGRGRHPRSGHSLGLLDSDGHADADGDGDAKSIPGKSRVTGRRFSMTSCCVSEIFDCPDGDKLGRSIPVVALVSICVLQSILCLSMSYLVIFLERQLC